MTRRLTEPPKPLTREERLATIDTIIAKMRRCNREHEEGYSLTSGGLTTTVRNICVCTLAPGNIFCNHWGILKEKKIAHSTDEALFGIVIGEEVWEWLWLEECRQGLDSYSRLRYKNNTLAIEWMDPNTRDEVKRRKTSIRNAVAEIIWAIEQNNDTIQIRKVPNISRNSEIIESWILLWKIASKMIRPTHKTQPKNNRIQLEIALRSCENLFETHLRDFLGRVRARVAAE